MDSSRQINVLWHTDILPAATRRALQFFADCQWLSHEQWYLAGGTALALQAGHRTSVDLDFFLPQKYFSSAKLLDHFSETSWVTDILREGTLYGRLFDAKISFIAYPFFVPEESFLHYYSVPVLHIDDIAVMKIVAISQRGRKRDFLDLFWYCTHCKPLSEVLDRLPNQYPTVSHNFYHILKSLTYFTDAEDDPMPKLFFRATWSEVKKYFQREVTRLTKKLLRL